MLSGFVVGVGGALYGHYFVTFSPFDFYFDITFLTIAMLVVGGMRSVTGAVLGTYFLTIINEAFRRWEVNGLGGVTPPSGTANLVLAFVLLVTLILRPRGITGGKEVPWPSEWRLPRWRRPSLAELRAAVLRTATESAAPVPEGAPGAEASPDRLR